VIACIDLSADQQHALDAILDWRHRVRGEDPHLTLGGYAGTGKTTLVSVLVERLPGVACAALSGKAAHVLRSKGVDARTVHSLIYYPHRTPRGVQYRRRRYLDGVETNIVDEASMIDHVLFRDLMSFGVPTLFVGDHGQLGPVGTDAGLMADPHLRLERIHRQAQNNPILRLAAAFREGRERDVPRPWADKAGRLRVANRADFHRFVAPGVQIVCGYTKTRHAVNARVRAMLGFAHLVQPGDRLICLKNNRTFGIFNGQQFVVQDVEGEHGRSVDLAVVTDDGRTFTLPCLKAQFGRDVIQDFRSKEVVLMDYGNCLTAHKAQGSEWDAVVVLEQIAQQWDARRWRYTAATRAKHRLIYCR
jgi:exodeoxyribonuclease-5